MPFVALKDCGSDGSQHDKFENKFPVLFLSFIFCFLCFAQDGNTLPLCSFVSAISSRFCSSTPPACHCPPNLWHDLRLSLPMQNPRGIVSAHPPPSAEPSRFYCAPHEKVYDKTFSLLIVISFITPPQNGAIAMINLRIPHHFSVIFSGNWKRGLLTQHTLRCTIFCRSVQCCEA